MNKKTLDVNDLLSSELSIINLICQLDNLCADKDGGWSIHDELFNMVLESQHPIREILDTEIHIKEL